MNKKLIDFNHVDFIWGNRAPAEVYNPILEIMQEDLKKAVV
jgi:hypothetical protein